MRRNLLQAPLKLIYNLWLFEIVFFSFLCAVVKELPPLLLPDQKRLKLRLAGGRHGGQDWTRTSDPRLIKAVL